MHSRWRRIDTYEYTYSLKRLNIWCSAEIRPALHFTKTTRTRVGQKRSHLRMENTNSNRSVSQPIALNRQAVPATRIVWEQNTHSCEYWRLDGMDAVKVRSRFKFGNYLIRHSRATKGEFRKDRQSTLLLQVMNTHHWGRQCVNTAESKNWSLFRGTFWCFRSCVVARIQSRSIRISSRYERPTDTRLFVVFAERVVCEIYLLPKLGFRWVRTSAAPSIERRLSQRQHCCKNGLFHSWRRIVLRAQNVISFACIISVDFLRHTHRHRHMWTISARQMQTTARRRSNGKRRGKWNDNW